jgi:hypothetical protein
MDALEHLAKVHQAATGCDVAETIAFLGNCIEALGAAPLALAQDANLQAERDQSRNPNGGTDMPMNRLRASGDQDPIPGGPGSGTPPRGGYDPTAIDDDPENGQIDAHTLLHCIELCRNGLLSQDQTNGTTEHNAFLSGLAAMLAAHANSNGNGMGQRNGNGNGNGNGMDRRGGARDQYAGRSPDNGVGAYGPGSSGSPSGSMDRGNGTRRPAQDAALAALAHKAFLKRFPGAARIRCQ